ncbi:MAG: TatD family hydrolase [Chloroflexi bacterium]|nr:TatD family hydrolase [Chloroflexota bacterium]
MLVDTHCHINFDAYDSDRAEILGRAADAGVELIIIPSVDLATNDEILKLTEEHSNLYGAVGIHPNSTAAFTDAMLGAIATASQSPKVIAIGEIGLDYHWRESPKGTQWKAFEAQLALAKQLELPVIIHNREASDDVMAILDAWVKDLPPALRERPGVMHSFSAPQAIAERALAAGFYLGFTGPITYKNADQLRHIAANIPLDRMLVETDGPFLTPVPHRGKRNEPAYIPLIVERLATIKQISPEVLGAATTENALRLFQITP